MFPANAIQNTQPASSQQCGLLGSWDCYEIAFRIGNFRHISIRYNLLFTLSLSAAQIPFNLPIIRLSDVTRCTNQQPLVLQNAEQSVSTFRTGGGWSISLVPQDDKSSKAHSICRAISNTANQRKNTIEFVLYIIVPFFFY